MRTIQRRCHFWLVTFTGLVMAASAHAAAPDLLTREICKEAVPQVRTAFAGVLEPVRDVDHCIAGDFNGDGKPDVLMVVRVLVDRVPAATGIKTIFPFSAEHGAKGRRQFLALHATPGTAEWTRSDKILLEGESAVRMLRYAGGGSDMRRVTSRSKELQQLQLPRRALKGEAVFLGTEAVDAILYWNGKTWVLHEDPAGP